MTDAGGGETGDPAWVFDGFRNVTQTITQATRPNYYIAENRVYWGYDKSLKTGPYNFGFLDDPDRQNWVEHFLYQNGLLVWYLDYSYPDNNVGDYCLAGNCGGFFLPWTPTRTCSSDRTARSGDRASSRMTRPSVSSARIASGCTSTVSARPTAASRPTPSSTTPRATGPAEHPDGQPRLVQRPGAA